MYVSLHRSGGLGHGIRYPRRYGRAGWPTVRSGRLDCGSQFRWFSDFTDHVASSHRYADCGHHIPGSYFNFSFSFHSIFLLANNAERPHFLFGCCCSYCLLFITLSLHRMSAGSIWAVNFKWLRLNYANSH